MDELQPELNNQPVMPQMPQEPAPMLIPPKHFGPKFFVALVAIIILAGASYGAIWWWWGRQQIAQEVVPTFTPRTDETADWKTYTNTQYGFEFKYPADWTLQDGKEQGISPMFNSVIITKNLSNKEYLRISFTSSKENLQQGFSGQEKISLAGIEWIGSQYNNGVPGEDAPHDSLAYFSKYAGLNFQVDLYPVTFLPYSTNRDINPILNQILSTFKFTDSVDTSTWKTYTNTQYGFEVKIPTDWNVEVSPDNKSISFVSAETKLAQEENKKNCSDPKLIEHCISDGFPPEIDFSNQSTLTLDIQQYHPNVIPKTYNGLDFKIHPIFGMISGMTYETQKNGQNYVFNVYNTAIIDQILSTFKFTK